MNNNNHYHIQACGLGKQVKSGDRILNILSDLNIQIPAASAIAIVGASGSGKSTLLGLLAGLDLPTSGNATLLGQSLNELTEDQRSQLRAGRVGFVFQSFQLLAGLTALENVALPLELSGEADSRERAQAALTSVGLQQRLHHFPRQLSGGEQQRVALARAFVIEPEVLFSDEPTGNLDKTTGQQVVDLMFSLRDANQTTLVLVTHDELLASRCDVQYRLDAGILSTPQL
ncbi:MAG: ATP-binding cassette domain-containing protein [Proteobacteria bacterium]|nr:ATP-binding cassette domain-containing protein [Pseudomonadota bacterium]